MQAAIPMETLNIDRAGGGLSTTADKAITLANVTVTATRVYEVLPEWL